MRFNKKKGIEWKLYLFTYYFYSRKNILKIIVDILSTIVYILSNFN